MAVQSSEQSIYLRAISLDSPAAQAAYLDEACRDNPTLRQELDALLAAHDRLGTVPVRGNADSQMTLQRPSAECAGTVIGPYKLVETIGEGGMGTVWMAQQTEPVKRLVALKLIKSGLDSRPVIARFQAERQALALMDHPNIAKVLDGGTIGIKDEGGRMKDEKEMQGRTDSSFIPHPSSFQSRPYFVMELVKGVPITRYCDEHHLTPRQRLELFVPVCQAIQHAHQKGIIHRDIKPSNVLVALYDDKPVPKIIDFGVAKATGQQLTELTLNTGFGTVVGTLEYMSPEQAGFNQLDIDTRSDIYSLGVLLYELLAGSPPFTRKDLADAGIFEMLRVIREQEPSKPSTKLSSSEALPSLSANRGTEPARLTKLVRGELDWIVMKALEKDRARRYETANGLAADLLRYLNDEQVQACPPSAAYRFRKFARRNKVSLAVATLVLFFLVLLGSGSGWAVRDRAARDAAAEKERQDREAEAVRTQAEREAEAARQQAARQGKVAGQVESIFAEVDRLEQEQKWPEALAAARRADAAMAGGEADAATAKRVRERLKDLEFIDRLGRIHIAKADIVRKGFNYAGANSDYALAFHDYGVDVDALAVETSIDRLKDRPALTIPLAMALDDWVVARHSPANQDAAGWKRLVAVARGIDPEPLRDRLRSTWGRPASETREELRRLAESMDGRAQPPATVAILANSLGRVDLSDLALRLMRDAQLASSGDFWLNFGLGFELVKRRDYAGGVRFYTAAVSIRPNSAVVHRNLGIALGGAKQWDEAISRFHKAIDLDPKCLTTNYNLGNALCEQKKWDAAASAYRQEIALDPKLAPAYANLGVALANQGQRDNAIASFRAAIDIDPLCFGAHRALGDVLVTQKKWHDAVASYRRALEIKPADAAVRSLLNPAEFDRTYAETHLRLGAILCDNLRDYENAAASFRKVIELRPDAKAYFCLGISLRRQNKLDEAVAAYKMAIELDPTRASAHYHLGAILCDNLRDYENAAACFRKVIELQPDANAYVSLGRALMGQKKPDDAVAAFRKAIEFDPKNANVHFDLGMILCNDLRDFENAVACFRKVIEFEPQNADAYACLSAALGQLGNRNDAIAACRKAIELDPKHAGAQNNLGINLNSVAWDLVTHTDPARRDPDRAVSMAKEAVELNPQVGSYWRTFGAAQYRARDWKATIAALEKSMALHKGGDSRDWFLLAMAHWQLGDKDKAREWSNKAMQWMEANAKDNPELIRFRTEAEELMKQE